MKRFLSLSVFLSQKSPSHSLGGGVCEIFKLKSSRPPPETCEFEGQYVSCS